MFAIRRPLFRAIVAKPLVKRRAYAKIANAILAEKLTINGDRLWYLHLPDLTRNPINREIQD